MYDFVESVKEYAEPNTNVSVAESYKTRSYQGFVFASCDPETVIDSNGYTVLQVYYDLDPDNAYQQSEQDTHTLEFVDSLTDNKLANDVQLAYGESLAGHVPANDPEPLIKGNDEITEVFEFTGWFADKMCSTQVFFTEKDYNEYSGYNKKVLYTEMPDNKLTIYAGWSAKWYIVEIDPNYGALDGVGSTWFWETFDGDLVEEYKNTKRDYVQSSSGEYYFVKHDRAYYGYSGNEWDNSEKDRDTYYSDDISLATEDTTFERITGLYMYAGWYEVLEDGSEVKYDFSKHVDHDLKLRLHWKKDGVYKVTYSYGDGSEIKDSTIYADQAGIPIVNTVPDFGGNIFVGWSVKGDESGRIYRVGDTLTLDAEYAVTIKGDEIVTLEAVYIKAGTAKIIYDANGGVINGSVDFGKPSDDRVIDEKYKTISGNTATISNLINNSAVILSNGTGFERDGMVLAGWSPVANYRADKNNPIYQLGGEYGVDSAEPVTLYAVWQVKATYHLNNSDSSASWAATGTVTSRRRKQGRPYISATFISITPYQSPSTFPRSAPEICSISGRPTRIPTYLTIFHSL